MPEHSGASALWLHLTTNSAADIWMGMEGAAASPRSATRTSSSAGSQNGNAEVGDTRTCNAAAAHRWCHAPGNQRHVCVCVCVCVCVWWEKLRRGKHEISTVSGRTNLQTGPHQPSERWLCSKVLQCPTLHSRPVGCGSSKNDRLAWKLAFSCQKQRLVVHSRRPTIHLQHVPESRQLVRSARGLRDRKSEP